MIIKEKNNTLDFTEMKNLWSMRRDWENKEKTNYIQGENICRHTSNKKALAGVWNFKT